MGTSAPREAGERYGVSRRVLFDRGTNLFLGAIAGGVAAGTLDLRLIVIVVLVAAWAAVRLARVSIVLDTNGLRVRNPWRSYAVTWDDVSKIRPMMTESKTSFLMPLAKVHGRIRGIRLWAVALPVGRIIFRVDDERTERDLDTLLRTWATRYPVRIKVADRT